MLLLLPLTFPSFVLVAFGASSFAMGLFGLAALYIPYILYYRLRVEISWRYLSILFILLTWGFAASVTEYGEIDERQIYSFLTLMLVIGCGTIYIAELLRRPYAYLKQSIYLAYGLLLSIGVVGLLGLPTPGPYGALSRPVFPFAEPSHFALVFCLISCLMICLVERFLRYVIVLVAAVLALFFPNATLLIGAILLAVTCLRSFRDLALVASVFIGVYVISTLSPETIEYFDSRLLDRDGDNISRLVYEQGWESVALSLNSTNFVGLGFQNLGKQVAGESTFALDGYTSASLNRLDGGFLFSKIVSEFGLAGAACCIFICYKALKSIITIIQHNNMQKIDENRFSRHVVPACCCYMFLIELFVRGVGYFSPTFIAMVCCSGLLVNIGNGFRVGTSHSNIIRL